ncbi:MAG: xanthine dehydrogenase family protein subunit M [Peptococcaceae bacterium]|nr:xanthine dehydrogenase family protein subunit M [Peptococcaceae bacterium]
MYLPDFAYYAPDTKEEAVELLVRSRGTARVIAGGTDLMVKMKQGLLSPEALVSLKNLDGLKEIGTGSGGLFIGSRVTLNELINSPVIQATYPSIAGAAHQMANNQIRHTGTMGGNLVSAVPSADLPPIFIALNARVRVTGPAGEREFPLSDLFLGPGRTSLAPGEILTGVVVPEQKTTGSTYLKFGLRRSGALAVVGVAAAVTMEGPTVKDARIVLGAVAPVPFLAGEAAKTLYGREFTTELAEEAGRVAASECRPISDIRGSAEYRRDLVRVFTRRSLEKAVREGHV